MASFIAVNTRRKQPYSNLLQDTSQLQRRYIQSITSQFYSISIVLSDDLFEVQWTLTCFEKISRYFIPSESDRFSNKFKHIEESCSKMKYFEVFSKHAVVNWITNRSPESVVEVI